MKTVTFGICALPSGRYAIFCDEEIQFRLSYASKKTAMAKAEAFARHYYRGWAGERNFVCVGEKEIKNLALVNSYMVDGKWEHLTQTQAREKHAKGAIVRKATVNEELDLVR